MTYHTSQLAQAAHDELVPVRQVLVGALEPATLVILSAPSATPAFLPVLVLLLAVLAVLLPLDLSLCLSLSGDISSSSSASLRRRL